MNFISIPIEMKASAPKKITVDANEAVARIAYKCSEIISIYPITPSSPMAESADEWAAAGRKNLWGDVPIVNQMQSEAGVAGAVHGALQTGAMTTTFTASQGLLLMIPVMYKIAGELTPFCLHVTARAIATHALSIFGDHSDVMACRQTGFAMLCSGSVQEAQDLALVSHAATLATRVPFLHFFDGFRTSHEISKIQTIDDTVMKAVLDAEAVRRFRNHGLNPDHPVIRGTAQNPDVFFQAREAGNPFYAATPGVVQGIMDELARHTGRSYHLFDYEGHPEADHVVIVMGSAAETLAETSCWLNSHGRRTGVLKIRLLRPFDLASFLFALPRSVRSIAVLDRTKEPGALGEPLYIEMAAAFSEARATGAWPGEPPHLIGGRYGLGSKEFTPAMARAVFDELRNPEPKNHFTVGIEDDVTRTSLRVDPEFSLEVPGLTEALFYGLGSDGTVGANKNSIKIIGEGTDFYAQGYFVYDSKKSGAMTISHLRFGRDPIRAPYLITRAHFVACHQFDFLQRIDILASARDGAVFLLNSPYDAAQVWDHLPMEAQHHIIEKQLRFYVIDAYRVARENGMAGRINTVMQTCFFAVSGILPREEAIRQIKEAVHKTYGKKGEDIVRKNCAAIDATLARLQPVEVPDSITSTCGIHPAVAPEAPAFVREVTAAMLAQKGDLLPVSAFPPDGTWPVSTSRWEKRNLATEIPVWDPALCIQCNKCVMVCPHSAIRAKFYPESALDGAPEGFPHVPFRSREYPDNLYTLQVAPEDCTGCGLCVAVCPARDRKEPKTKAINMAPQAPLRSRERARFDFFLRIPSPDRTTLRTDAKHSQFLDPLFEFSGACAGCGETPYLKLLTQLFGDRMLIANATGCSSIYGGNLPTTPYTTDAHGRGPAWANSLFENNAEFGLGLRLGADLRAARARRLLQELTPVLPPDLVRDLLTPAERSEQGLAARRARIVDLQAALASIHRSAARELAALADALAHKTVWIVGGDGWAYDIGYGGLDHVLASGADVNILVLDTQVYSNTGGQQSKATPIGAVAKFAAGGKLLPRKNLAALAMEYGHVYVAQIALGAKDSQTVEVLREAESFPGPSLVIAYSHCIAHGFNLCEGMAHQKAAVDSGLWPIFRHDPRRVEAGVPALKLDCTAPKGRVADFMDNETRFRILRKVKPEQADALARAAAAQAQTQWERLETLSQPRPARLETAEESKS
jgi:pyruvate-ferredoxin/flavodoxin oxidoreductase